MASVLETLCFFLFVQKLRPTPVLKLETWLNIKFVVFGGAHVSSELRSRLLGACRSPNPNLLWISRFSLARLITTRSRHSDMHDRIIEKFTGGTLHDITYTSPKGGPLAEYLMVPKGSGPFAAVLFGPWANGTRASKLSPELLIRASRRRARPVKVPELSRI
jgi:hypothetical protein